MDMVVVVGDDCVTKAVNLPNYLIGLSVVTLGLDGENLGSDEAEIIHIGWVVVESETGKIIAEHSSYVQPQDLSKINWELSKQKDVDEEIVKNAPSLHEVLQQFETYAATQLQVNGVTNSFVFVVDGPLPMRQVLHPEALKKAIQLPKHYWTFFDIKKEYRRLFNNNENLNTLQDILTTCGLDNDNSTGGSCVCVKLCHDLGTTISKLVVETVQKGLECFGEPEVIKPTLEHGICTKDDVIDSNTVIRARGLPWQSSDQDVARFFVGLNIAKGGVALCLSQQGRRNGEALVRFETAEQREMALKRHRHFMGNRYIEVYRATGEDFINVAAGNNDAAQQFLSLGEAVIVRMRGLPYDCTAEKIIEFFKTGDNAVVGDIDPEKDILFVNKSDGRATGDAFVRFVEKGDDVKALAKHKEVIGTRYIELFRSTTAEVQQVLNKTMESMKPEINSASTTPCLMTGLPTSAMMPGLGGPLPGLMPQQQLVISGSRKDCVRLRGLPYEAQVQHILDFLGEFAKHIVLQGVHMVFNAQGHPSGEAFIQLDSEQAAAAAASDRHNKYMQIGKKQRYIEVFQCSADDMNLVLTGPSALPSSLLPAAAAVHARPMISPALDAWLSAYVSSGGNFYQNSALAAAGLLPSPFLSHQQLLSPQILGAGALQNGALAAAAAAAGVGTIPGMLGGAARLPVIPNLTGLLPAVNSPGAVLYPYWPYPSPPVSPSSYYAAAAHAQQVPGIVLLRGLPYNATTGDILNLFQNFPEVTAECVQIQRTPGGQPTGEAFITFSNRLDAERAVLEKNRQILGSRPVELYVCGI